MRSITCGFIHHAATPWARLALLDSLGAFGEKILERCTGAERQVNAVERSRRIRFENILWMTSQPVHPQYFAQCCEAAPLKAQDLLDLKIGPGVSLRPEFRDHEHFAIRDNLSGAFDFSPDPQYSK